MFPILQQLVHISIFPLESDTGQGGSNAKGCQHDMDGGGLSPGQGQVMERQFSDRRMLSYVDRGTDGTLTVDEIVKGEGKMRVFANGPGLSRVGIQGEAVGSVKGLHEPLANAYEVLGYQISAKDW